MSISPSQFFICLMLTIVPPLEFLHEFSGARFHPSVKTFRETRNSKHTFIAFFNSLSVRVERISTKLLQFLAKSTIPVLFDI